MYNCPTHSHLDNHGCECLPKDYCDHRYNCNPTDVVCSHNEAIRCNENNTCECYCSQDSQCHNCPAETLGFCVNEKCVCETNNYCPGGNNFTLWETINAHTANRKDAIKMIDANAFALWIPTAKTVQKKDSVLIGDASANLRTTVLKEILCTAFLWVVIEDIRASAIQQTTAIVPMYQILVATTMSLNATIWHVHPGRRNIARDEPVPVNHWTIVTRMMPTANTIHAMLQKRKLMYASVEHVVAWQFLISVVVMILVHVSISYATSIKWRSVRMGCANARSIRLAMLQKG